ncbi:MAG: GNAT family N-acetyltransferase [Thermodesulfobacteriota bacterium]|nr:GNAT family N-acetyltransferase [Thermodesulfobacteriota bacterium]
MTREGSPLSLREMGEEDIEGACRLIADSMNRDEARWARRTMGFHFGCKKHGLDDGRHYFVYPVDEPVKGLVGLHHYPWGPEENVWLSWFAVDPRFQEQGIGRALLASVQELAVGMGFSKLFVETYSQREFQKARRFYEANGFQKAGHIKDYSPSSHDMIVFKKQLVA